MDDLKSRMAKHSREVDKLKALWSVVKEREIKSLRCEMQLNSLEKALKAQSMMLDEKQEQVADKELELDHKQDFLLREEIRIDTLRGYGKTS